MGGGGKGILVSQGGNRDLYFGGAGRLLFGRVIGPRWSVQTGVEAGASASFPRDQEGDRGSLVLGVDVVVPAVVRLRLINTYVEAQAGYLARFTEAHGRTAPGVHFGLAFGGRASRQRWFFPGAAFGISYERDFPDPTDGKPLHTIKIGFRAALDTDL